MANVINESLVDRHTWWRIASSSWGDPLDAGFARDQGGRWNPPESFSTLNLNEDVVTARINMQLFTEQWPYEPEDLRSANAPNLIGVALPRRQLVADVHTPEGCHAVGLPPSYPLDVSGQSISHDQCQAIGLQVHEQGLRGVRSRSAQAPLGAGRELAWFPATTRSKARATSMTPFEEWFWS